MVGINHVGENVIDLECIVDKMNGTEVKKITRQNNGKPEEIDGLVFPPANPGLDFVVYDPIVNQYYAGKINPKSDGIVGGTTLLVPKQKFDQVGSLRPITLVEYDLSNNIKLRVIKRSPGGGAINCGIGVQVLLDSLRIGNGVANRIIVPNGDEYIQKFLLGMYNISEYHPQGWNNAAGLNVIINLNGKSINLRSSYDWPYRTRGSYTLPSLQSGDFVVVNTIKDWEYLNGLLGEVSGDGVKRVLIATDSSIGSMGRDVVNGLSQRCSIVVSNDAELNQLVNGRKKELEKEDPRLLVEAMQEVGKGGAIVYTTLAERGIAVYYGGYAYKQRTAIAPFQAKYVNGCGDATTAQILIGTLLGYDTISILVDANIAGQINAQNPTASSKDMATRERVEQFKAAYRLAPLEVYSPSEKRFVPIF